MRVTYVKGNGGIYPYFFCLGRQSGNGCDQPYLCVGDVEEQVASFYASQSLAATDSQKLRLAFRTQLKADQKVLTAEAVRQGSRLEELMTERRK